jgi:microcystin-dependent protein
VASYEIEELRARLPAGRCLLYAGAGTPARFLPCDGSAVSRSTYADLFTAIGTTYGAGDGTTTFNLPTLAAVSGVPWFIAT